MRLGHVHFPPRDSSWPTSASGNSNRRHKQFNESPPRLPVRPQHLRWDGAVPQIAVLPSKLELVGEKRGEVGFVAEMVLGPARQVLCLTHIERRHQLREAFDNLD